MLVNSASQHFSDFEQYIRPYLDNFGIPYTVLDIAHDSIGQDIADKALIIIGHNGLDESGTYLDAAEESFITNAIFYGTGLVNFDTLIADAGNQPLYPYVQSILGLTYQSNILADAIRFVETPGLGSFITVGHDKNEIVNLKTVMTSLGMIPPQDAQVVATTGGMEPFIVVRKYGQGRVVQWGSYGFTHVDVLGYVHKLDDLVWRSLVWAARKPFVLQGMPPLVTFRVDDCSGPFWWAQDAVTHGFKPWIGFFLDDMDEATTADLASLVNSGNATASIHAFNIDTCFYYKHTENQNGEEYTDAEIAAHFAEGTQWHQQHNIPISKFVVPHQYEFGTNVFDGLATWGVEFVGTIVSPGSPEISSWLQMAPYRKYTSDSARSRDPFYYADYLSIPGHPEYERSFFNVVTEIRDNAGYEWFPDNDVNGSIERGVTQLKRAFGSMALATLFTHEVQSIQFISRSNWNSILSGIVSGVASYEPIYTTMDSAAQYVRALVNSNIDRSDFDPYTSTLTTTLAGQTDVPTQFYLFTELPAVNESIIVRHSINVPVFSGSTQIVTVIDNTAPSISLVWLEGESGSLTAPMVTGTDSQASSGTYVWIPEGSGNVLDDPSQAVGAAAYTFTVPVAGNYVVWGRLIDNLGNSFFVSMDSGPYVLWDTVGGSTWGWDLVNNREVADPVVYALGAGQHTLVIKHREDGAKLDRILITNDSSYVPQGQGEVVPSPNPLPTLSSLSPASATAGGAAFTLTVTGTGFVSGSGVRWNGSARTTTFVSATQLRASILASDIAAAGTASVTVVTPAPGGGTSNALSFTITASNPLPTLSSLSPASATAGGAAFTLTVTGTGFVSGSGVRWNGSARTTTFVSATQLRASILASDIAAAGTASVTVVTPAPGGGTSNALSFTITAPSISLVWLEGESGSLTAPMVTGTDSQASSGTYVWIPEGSGNVLDDPSQAVGAAAYTFTVPVAGNYVVWGRLIDNLGNSFFVSMDSGPYVLWDTVGGSTWGWDLVNNREVADPVVYALGAGQHTLVIKHREDGAKLDRILITNDSSYVPQGQGE